MSPTLERWLKETCLAVHHNLQEGESISVLKEKLGTLLDRILPMANVRERKYLIDQTLRYRKTMDARLRIKPDIELSQEMTRPCYMKTMEHAANEMDKRLQVKAKAQILGRQLDDGRHQATVFYVCSTHQKPAEDHAAWQGRLYVDRYWRQTMKNCGMERYIPTVLSYIERNDILTVQEIIGKPVYMITRPYCRHYFVPLSTSEVLGADRVRDILRMHPETRMPNHRPLSDAKRRQIYNRRRATIREKMRKEEA